MKRPLNSKSLAVLSIVFGLSISCGGPNVPDPCSLQSGETDCMTIGNNLLAFSSEFAGHQCVWKDSKCLVELK